MERVSILLARCARGGSVVFEQIIQAEHNHAPLAKMYDLTDAEGSVLTSLSSSAVLGEQIYGPYGNQRYTQGTICTDKGYTGQFQDAVSGFDYYNARYYDPVRGQFLSADNVQGNAQGMDPYAYVNGNPETATDPTGQRISYPPDCGGSTSAPCTYLTPGCKGDCGDACGGGSSVGSSNPCQLSGGNPVYCGGQGGGGKPSPGNGGSGSKPPCSGASCCQGTHWNGSACVPYPDHTTTKNQARKNKLAPAVILSVGLLIGGAILIDLADFYAIKQAIDGADIPALITAVLGIISALSEAASGLSFISAGAAAVAYGLLGILHSVLAIANGVLSVYNAVMAGFSWMKGVLQPALKLIGITVQGAPGALFDIAGELFGKAIVYGGRALGHAMMAMGNAGLTGVAYEESMNVDDWCTQYGQGIAACAAS